MSINARKYPASNRTVPLKADAMDVKLSYGQAQAVEAIRISAVFSLLDPLEREVYRLSSIQGMTQEAIGSSLGVSRWQVNRILREAKAKIAFLIKVRSSLIEDKTVFLKFMGGARCEWCRGIE